MRCITDREKKQIRGQWTSRDPKRSCPKSPGGKTWRNTKSFLIWSLLLFGAHACLRIVQGEGIFVYIHLARRILSPSMCNPLNCNGGRNVGSSFRRSNAINGMFFALI